MSSDTGIDLDSPGLVFSKLLPAQRRAAQKSCLSIDSEKGKVIGADHFLVRTIGRKNALLLQEEFGGGTLELGSLATFSKRLRGEGVDIETIHEKHEGEFPGHHARYVLRSKVAPVTGYKVEEAA